MKTREITGYVNPNFLDDKRFNFFVNGHELPRGDLIQAKLIIAVPEKKVTLTESEFDEASDEFNTDTPIISLLKLKRKLFSKGADDE